MSNEWTNHRSTRTLVDRFDDVHNVLDWIPGELQESIKSRTSTVDLTSFIQLAIDSLPPYSAVFVPSGKYFVSNIMLNGTLKDKNGTLLYGVGSGSHIIKLARTEDSPPETGPLSVIYMEGGSGLGLKNLKVEGDVSRGGSLGPTNDRHCIHAFSTSKLTVSNVETTDACIHGIYLNGCYQTTIKKCYSHHNGTNNFKLVRSPYTNLTTCHSVGSQIGIDFGTASNGSVCANCIVEGEANTSQGITVYQAERCTLSNFVITVATLGLNVTNAHDSTMMNGTIKDTGTAVNWGGTYGSTLANISVMDTTSHGFNINNSRDSTFSNLKALRCGVNGIFLINSRASVFSSINIKASGSSGLWMNNSRYINFTSLNSTESNTTAASATGSGLEIFNTSDCQFMSVATPDGRNPRLQQYTIYESGTSNNNAYIGIVHSGLNLSSIPIVLSGANSQCLLSNGPDSVRVKTVTSMQNALQFTAGNSTVPPTIGVVTHPGGTAAIPAILFNNTLRYGTAPATTVPTLANAISFQTSDGATWKIPVFK